MVRKSNTSRLAETDFSANNLREAYISDNAEYIAALRDEAIFSNYGINVLVRIPVNDFGELNENNVDEYSNFVDIEWLDTTEAVIPKFTEYRQNVSEDGMSADGTDGIYPLEILIPSKLHLPRNSRIVLSEYNSREEKIAREWVVLGTTQKQLSDSKTYSRVANCVPAREETINTITLEVSEFWFNGKIDENLIEKTKEIKAQGTMWFYDSMLDNGAIRKTFEYLPDLPQSQEIKKPKKISLYETNALFISKTISLSVLN